MPDERLRGDEARPESRSSPRPADDDDVACHPRPRRREREREREAGDATGGLIPYKNDVALYSYYCGVFGLIPLLGLLLGPIALILGILGFRYAQRRPKAGGMAHAVVGIILGGIVVAGHIALIIAIAVAAV